MQVMIPKNYKPTLTVLETQEAIKYIRDTFQSELGKQLRLSRISAPLFVTKKSGLNDNLNGIERPVSFEMQAMPDEVIEVVQSLAKWKRFALKKYNYKTDKSELIVPVGEYDAPIRQEQGLFSLNLLKGNVLIYGAPSSGASAPSGNGLHEGSVIEHERFGVGTVVKVEGTGENTKATVQFRNTGTKQLLLKFARFKVIN